MNGIKTLGSFFNTPYTVERGGKGGFTSGGGGAVSFNENVYGVTEKYGGHTLDPTKNYRYLGADGKSSRMNVAGFTKDGQAEIKVTDIDGTKNLEVDLEVGKDGQSHLKVSNPGQEGALGILCLDFGKMDDSAMFGTTKNLSENAGMLKYLKTGQQFGVVMEGPSGLLTVFSNEHGSLKTENAPCPPATSC